MKYPPIDLGDGHKCYSGPNCERHGGRGKHVADEREAFITEVATQEKATATEPTTTYGIPISRIPEAIAQVEKANQKLARYPEITDRYSYVVGEMNVRTDSYGNSTAVQEFTVTKPVLRINGWSFAAAHEFTANGDVTTFVADPEVTEQLGSKAIDNHCDYCGSNRARERVYWLKGEGGEVKQVGSTCLKGFLGVAPSGLWALESNLNLGSFGGGGSVDSRVYDREALLTAALAASNDGADFVTGGKANHYTPATGDVVVDAWDKYSNAEFSPERREHARAILNWLDNAEAQPGDYMGNLKAAIGSGAWVKRKHVRLAVSAISAHSKHLERQAAEAKKAEQIARQKPEYLAPEGAKLKDLRLKVTKSMHFPNGFGGMTMLIMEDAEGHVVKWNATSASYSEGDEVLVKSATVKDNDLYNGQYQTVLTRARTEKA